MRRLSVIGLVTVAACGAGSTPTTTLPPPLPTTTTIAPPASGYEISTCSSAPPRDWSVLCHSYRLVAEHHLDAPDPAELSAAAAAGVRAYETEGGTRPSLDEAFRCTLPDPSFRRSV